MGHYASEMGLNEPTIPTPEELEKRAAEDQSRREFVWDLMYRRREQAVYDKPSDQISCPKCAAVVRCDGQVHHDEWHVKLNRRIQMAGSLFGAGLLGYEEV